METITIFWFRRDLRLEDNRALFEALNGEKKVLPIFIFDTAILNQLEKPTDLRVQFIHQELLQIKNKLETKGGSLLIKYGKPLEVWQSIIKEFPVFEVYCNRDYEPYAQHRDQEVFELLKAKGITFKGYKDHVVLEKNEVLKADGKPYTVFTPYMKCYKSLLQSKHFTYYSSENFLDKLFQLKPQKIISLEEMGFAKVDFDYPLRVFNKSIIANYHTTRDFPALTGTTRLSLHLRFGTISLRRLMDLAKDLNQKYFNELIWRDFYQAILYHFPHTLTKPFRAEYDMVQWENNEAHFKAWCEGKTGFPLVDAGMRELNETGFMHNRVRMLVASFLTKHLLIDWRWGESYFAQKLLDYDAASNIGGWQWAAGCGVDAAPYFRIFNPKLQLERFDKDYEYVKKWLPEFETTSYPKPIVDHSKARNRAIERYKFALTKN